MKLQVQGAGKSRDGVEAGFGRSGRSLRQAVGNALTGSLEAIGGRLNTNTWFAKDENVGMQPHVHRLREVLDRDRALIAANPELNADERPAAAPTPFRPLPPPAPSARPPAPEVAPAPPSTPAPTATPSPELACKEPIRTRTMARLLASQGHPERALSIYDYLLARPGADESLRAEAEALRSAGA